MRVLVTGATGMLGAAVTDALLARGDEVAGLTRDPEKARSQNGRVTWHGWNAAEERPPAAALEGVDAVINLIGEEINQRLTDAAKQRIRESRIRATKNLVDGILAADPQPRTLVSQAAVGIYGDCGDTVVDESGPAGDGFLAQVVVDWETAARGAEAGGVRVAIMRTGLVLDPEGGLLGELLLPFRLGVGGPLAGGRQYMSWIHRDDEVGLILWALDNERASGVYNATAPNPVTNREFSKSLGRAMRRPAIVPVPRAALVALRGEELTRNILASLRVIPARALDDGYEFRFAELDPALRDLV